MEPFRTSAKLNGVALTLPMMGCESRLALKPGAVAAFFEIVMAELVKAGAPVEIGEHPSDILNAIPFRRDRVHSRQ